MSLAEARKKVGLTQAEVAETVGVSRSLIGLIELGKRRPDYGLAKKLSKLYKKPMNDLFFDFEGFKMNRKRSA